MTSFSKLKIWKIFSCNWFSFLWFSPNTTVSTLSILRVPFESVLVLPEKEPLLIRVIFIEFFNSYTVFFIEKCHHSSPPVYESVFMYLDMPARRAIVSQGKLLYKEKEIKRYPSFSWLFRFLFSVSQRRRYWLSTVYPVAKNLLTSLFVSCGETSNWLAGE